MSEEPGPRPDQFAALLGIEITQGEPGNAVATLRTGPQHTNPHGTIHGAVFYAVAGASIAAAANNETYSGIITNVVIDYLRPAQAGDELQSHASVAERTKSEDIFVARVERVTGDERVLVARATARGTRRERSG